MEDKKEIEKESQAPSACQDEQATQGESSERKPLPEDKKSNDPNPQQAVYEPITGLTSGTTMVRPCVIFRRRRSSIIVISSDDDDDENVIASGAPKRLMTEADAESKEREIINDIPLPIDTVETPVTKTDETSPSLPGDSNEGEQLDDNQPTTSTGIQTNKSQ